MICRRACILIATTLRNAAGPEVPIVGGTYYQPLLALWVQHPLGRIAARALIPSHLQFNEAIRKVYGATGVAIADLEKTFSTTDFSRVGTLPLNVVRVCQWTWMCGPEGDTHPNNEGYRIIAGAFTKAIAETGAETPWAAVQSRDRYWPYGREAARACQKGHL